LWGKFDGERVLLEVSETITIANKHKSVYTHDVLPAGLIKNIRKAIKTKALLDAEFYSLKGNLYNFLSARAKLNEDLALAVFDVINIQGLDYRNLPLTTRKHALAKILDNCKRIHQVDFYICHDREQILNIYNHFIKKGFEGVVIKPDKHYYVKWLKLKKTHTTDVIILGVKKTESWLKERIPITFLVGYYQSKPLGEVGSGLTYTEREAIAEFIDELKTSEDNQYIYLKPEIVLEIEYQEQTENGLRSARISRIRFDKEPKECKP